MKRSKLMLMAGMLAASMFTIPAIAGGGPAPKPTPVPPATPAQLAQRFAAQVYSSPWQPITCPVVWIDGSVASQMRTGKDPLMCVWPSSHPDAQASQWIRTGDVIIFMYSPTCPAGCDPTAWTSYVRLYLTSSLQSALKGRVVAAAEKLAAPGSIKAYRLTPPPIMGMGSYQPRGGGSGVGMSIAVMGQSVPLSFAYGSQNWLSLVNDMGVGGWETLDVSVNYSPTGNPYDVGSYLRLYAHDQDGGGGGKG